jgi:uncharacterized protein (TIGR00369 family)
VRDEDEALERVRTSFALQGFMEHLGAELIEVAPGRVVIRLPFQERLTQQDGYFHAGATSAVADSAGGYAALTVFPMESAVLTIEFKINLLAPATGGHLEAIGSVVRSRRTMTARSQCPGGPARLGYSWVVHDPYRTRGVSKCP